MILLIYNIKKLITIILAGDLTTEMKHMVLDMIDKNRELLEYLSPENWIDSITDKVFIMHGANDSMVPFTESMLLDKQLPISEMLISFVYEHKEISKGYGIFFKMRLR